MIDIGTIEREHLGKLAENGRTGGLDAKYFKDLGETIGISPSRVDAWDGEHFGQRTSTCLQNKVEAARIFLAHENGAIFIDLWSDLGVDEGARHARDTAEGEIVQHFIQESSQTFIVIFTIFFLVFGVRLVIQADTDHLLVSVHIAVDDGKISTVD